MPTINISPVIRFFLYLLAAISLLVVSYAVDKSWAGDAEVRLVTGLAALINLLAAAKTNLSDTVLVSGEFVPAEDDVDSLTYEEAGGQDFPITDSYSDEYAKGDPNRP